ncbi:MAG TPA: VCBS repeat-containing protein, partial [Polyangiaceae bacterium]|nr:VCBS repeat-containing protein [Polyangiaceae bacterium]
MPGTKLGGVAAHGTTGDFNHDGLLDLATADTDASLISILLGHGDGNFTALNQRTAPLPVTLTAADLNADGHLDLVAITGDERAAVTVELGAGDGRFALGDSYTLGAALYDLTIGDFDGDHLLDIAVAASAGALLLHG